MCAFLLPAGLQSGGCDPYFVIKVTNGVLKDFTVFDYRLHVPKKKARAVDFDCSKSAWYIRHGILTH